MSDEQILDDDESGESGGVRSLREALDRANEKATRADSLERELAFVKAGIDTDSGTGKLLFKAYEGDLTPEAVKAAAVEAGILAAESDGDTGAQPDPSTPTPPTGPSESAVRGAITSESVPVGKAGAADMFESIYAEFKAATASGMAKDEAANQGIAAILAGAYRDNNPRFIFDPAAHSEAAKAAAGDLL